MKHYLVTAQAEAVPRLPLGAQVQREVNHALLAVQVLLLANTVEYNINNGQLSDITGSAHVTGSYLANAIVSDKSNGRK